MSGVSIMFNIKSKVQFGFKSEFSCQLALGFTLLCAYSGNLQVFFVACKLVFVFSHVLTNYGFNTFNLSYLGDIYCVFVLYFAVQIILCYQIGFIATKVYCIGITYILFFFLHFFSVMDILHRYAICSWLLTAKHVNVFSSAKYVGSYGVLLLE